MAIMNLISIEGHLCFIRAVAGKETYFKLLKETRGLEGDLLKKIIHDYKGEIWCISNVSYICRASPNYDSISPSLNLIRGGLCSTLQKLHS
jgi:hypothetical protein